MSRFKDKLSTMNKEGHIGVAKDTKEPIKKLDMIGFKSGMSGVSMISVNSGDVKRPPASSGAQGQRSFQTISKPTTHTEQKASKKLPPKGERVKLSSKFDLGEMS